MELDISCVFVFIYLAVIRVSFRRCQMATPSCFVVLCVLFPFLFDSIASVVVFSFLGVLIFLSTIGSCLSVYLTTF